MQRALRVTAEREPTVIRVAGDTEREPTEVCARTSLGEEEMR